MEKIICPICNSSRNKFYYQKNNCTLYRCLDCRLVFVFPIPDNLCDIYKQEYFQGAKISKKFGYVNYEKDKEPSKEMFIHYLNKLARMTEGRDIFDIGTATGYFLDLAKQRGWYTTGSEISSYAANIARQKGRNIFLGDLENFKAEKKFDVVTMWDVLEHLENPHKYIKIINRLLKKEGLLVINTIDKGSLWAKLWGKHWLLIIPPEHLFYYSKKNLNILLSQNGFEVLEIKKIGKKFTLTYIFQILYNSKCLEIWNKMAKFFNTEFWRKITIPINLRDNIFIIAQKAKDI